jgi:hypothetical protein
MKLFFAAPTLEGPIEARLRTEPMPAASRSAPAPAPADRGRLSSSLKNRLPAFLDSLDEEEFGGFGDFIREEAGLAESDTVGYDEALFIPFEMGVGAMGEYVMPSLGTGGKGMSDQG